MRSTSQLSVNPIRWCAVAALALWLGTGAITAQPKPDFSGTWTPVGATKADSALTITQDEKTLTIAHPHGDGAHKSTYDLSGREHRAPNPGHPQDMDVSTATWEGDRLVLDVTLANGVRTKRILWFDEARRLVIENAATIPGRSGPPQIIKTVYRK